MNNSNDPLNTPTPDIHSAPTENLPTLPPNDPTSPSSPSGYPPTAPTSPVSKKAFYQNPWFYVGALTVVSIVSLATAGYALVSSNHSESTNSSASTTNSLKNQIDSEGKTQALDENSTDSPKQLTNLSAKGPIQLTANCTPGPCLMIYKTGGQPVKKHFSGILKITLDESYSAKPIDLIVKSIGNKSQQTVTCQIQQGESYNEKHSASGAQSFTECSRSSNGEAKSSYAVATGE